MHSAGVVGRLSVGALSVEALFLWLYSAVLDCAVMTNLAFVYNLVLTRRLSLVRSPPLLAWTLCCSKSGIVQILPFAYRLELKIAISKCSENNKISADRKT